MHHFLHMFHIVVGRLHMANVKTHLEESWTARWGILFQLLSRGAFFTSRPAGEKVDCCETHAQDSDADFDR